MENTSSPRDGLPRSLFAFSVLYGGMVCLAGILGNKQVSIGPLAVEAGIFAFLLLVILSSAVAELHGPQRANMLVKFGFIPMILAIFLSLFVLGLPPSPDMEPQRQQAFELMMRSTPRIWFAGICAYGVSQFLNVYIFSRLSAKTGKWLALRGIIASVLSQIVDTLIFISIAFYGVFPIAQLMAGQVIAKITLSIIAVPLLIIVLVKIGRKLDEAS